MVGVGVGVGAASWGLPIALYTKAEILLKKMAQKNGEFHLTYLKVFVLFNASLIFNHAFKNLLDWRHDIQCKGTQPDDTQYNDTQHNDTQHNDTQHNDTQYKYTQNNNST